MRLIRFINALQQFYIHFAGNCLDCDNIHRFSRIILTFSCKTLFSAKTHLQSLGLLSKWKNITLDIKFHSPFIQLSFICQKIFYFIKVEYQIIFSLSNILFNIFQKTKTTALKDTKIIKFMQNQE